MDLSIVIPCYNVAEYIEDCLSSIFDMRIKTDLKIEVLIINDGSTDDTLSKIERFLYLNDTANFLYKVLSHKNQGLSYTRNRGLLEAKGTYVYFLDSDDWIDLNFLLKIVENCLDKKYDIGVGNFYEVRDGVLSASSKKIKESKNYRGVDVLKQLYIDKISSVVWRNVFRKNFLLDNNLLFENGRYFEDVEFMPRAFYYAEQVHCYTSYFYFYRIRDSSIMQSEFSLKKLKDLIYIAQSLSLFKEKLICKRSKNIINKIVFSLLLTAITKGSSIIEKEDRDIIIDLMNDSKCIPIRDFLFILFFKRHPLLVTRILKFLVDR